MPIKNYTTKVPANRSIEEIQSSLVSHGAIGMLYEYEKGTGRIAALRFVLEYKDKPYNFTLPVDWREFQEISKKQHIKRWDDEDYVYRVAWRCLRDWVLAQMALYETKMVEMPQIFLPFMNDQLGNTIYEKFKIDDQFLLGSGE